MLARALRRGGDRLQRKYRLLPIGTVYQAIPLRTPVDMPLWLNHSLRALPEFSLPTPDRSDAYIVLEKSNSSKKLS